MTVSLAHYLVLSALLFFIGAMGVLGRRNALTAFMSIELMLNAANLSFVAFSRYWGGMDGQIVAFFVMAVAAAEAAIGLAILIMIFRVRQTANLDEMDILRE